MRIVGVDPGSEKSAIVVVDLARSPELLEHGILENGKAITLFREGWLPGFGSIVDGSVWIEEIRPFGPRKPMSGACLDTQFWAGRFYEACKWRSQPANTVARKTYVADLLGTARANDTAIRQFVLAYFDCRDMKEAKGKSGEPGPLHGVADDQWQAIAIAIYGYRQRQIEKATC